MNEVIKAIMNRRSIRKFNNEKVSDEQLKLIIESGRYAPSAMNRQLSKIVAVRDQTLIEEAVTMLKKVTGNENYNGFYDAKLVIHVFGPEDIPTAEADAALILENMMLAASSLDVASVWVNQLKTYRNEEDVKEYLKRFNMPEGYNFLGSLSLGKSDIDIHFDRENKIEVKIIE